MKESQRPKPMERKCFQLFFPAIPRTVAIPNTPNIKYSGGPNFKAKEASNGAQNIKTRELVSPPNTELVIQILKASSPRPFCLILNPSSAVTIAEAVPGISNRTAGIEPPQADDT